MTKTYAQAHKPAHRLRRTTLSSLAPKSHPAAAAKVREVLHGPRLQLTAGAPDDGFEREADHLPRSAPPYRLTDPGAVMATAALGVSGVGQELPFRRDMEAAFECSFADVRVHSDAAAVRTNRLLGAEAYTFGNQIALASASPSRGLIAHELAHIVQQRAGVRLQGGVGAAGDGREHQADAVAGAVAAGRSVAGLLAKAPSGPNAALTPGPPATVAVQCAGAITAASAGGSTSTSTSRPRTSGSDSFRMWRLWCGHGSQRTPSSAP